MLCRSKVFQIIYAMKKLVKVLMLSVALTAFGVTASYAQEVVIGARLYHHHRDVRPPRPSPRHVWIGGEWTPNGATYAWKSGYWAEPPRGGAQWISGHWRRRRGGWVWVPGHWD